MRKLFNYISINFIVLLLPVIGSAQLSEAYLQQYTEYNASIKRIEDTIGIYSSCIEKFEIADNQLLGLQMQIKERIISRPEAIKMQILINEDKLNILTEGLAQFNKVNADNRQSISILEIKQELNKCRFQLDDKIARKQELKLRILEKQDILPSWWTQ